MMKKIIMTLKLHKIILAFLVLSLAAILQSTGTAYAAAAADKTAVSYAYSDDPFTDTQWYIDNRGYYSNLSDIMIRNELSTADVDMDVVEAWDKMQEAGVPQREVVVAVIDTGVDYMHPDLAAHMWINQGEIPGDNIDNDGNGYIDDIYGWDFYNGDGTVGHYEYNQQSGSYMASPKDNDNHGTHIAGIIAAVADNKTGIAGIASRINIRIMSLKINGGPKGEGNVRDAIEAIKYAQMMGADICNISWGVSEYYKELEDVMKESDMLFVTAAGNTGGDNDKKPIYPAGFNLENKIAVTFIDADGSLTGYSNYGPATIDLAAPGDDIFSTIVGSYGSMSGSSMAAPQVTAIAALIYAYGDNLYPANVKDIIINNVKYIDGLKDLMRYPGIPSAYLAVMATDSLKTDTDAPMMSFDTVYNKSEMIVPVKVIDSGESKVRVIRYIYGNKTAEDFRHGVGGTAVVNGEAILSKAGTYTFFAADYAGNETVQTYEVADDTIAPKVYTTYTVAPNYKTRSVTATIRDEQSGIKRVKYMPGMKSAEAFLPADAGTVIDLKNGKASFKVEKDGVYTIFAIDNRGNATTKPLLVRTVKSTELKLTAENKTIGPGDYFVIENQITPIGSTDRITYQSSDENVVKVSATGKVTALAEGRAAIKVTTASGITATCFVTVKLKT